MCFMCSPVCVSPSLPIHPLPLAPWFVVFMLSCLHLKSYGFQNKSVGIHLANVGMINSQKGILTVTCRIMGNYKSLLPGDQITYLCKVKENLLGNSVGFAGKLSDLLLWWDEWRFAQIHFSICFSCEAITFGSLSQNVKNGVPVSLSQWWKAPFSRSWC